MSRPMLPTPELKRLREDLEKVTLPDTCVIQALISVSDGQGSFSETWAAAGTVACRLDNSSGQKTVVGQSVRPFSAWVLTVPQSAELTTANRVEVNSETYAVIALSDSGSLLACQRAHVERVG